MEVLDALDNREDVVLGLLTGNVELGARIKLTAAGINPDRFRSTRSDPTTSTARSSRQ